MDMAERLREAMGDAWELTDEVRFGGGLSPESEVRTECILRAEDGREIHIWPEGTIDVLTSDMALEDGLTYDDEEGLVNKVAELTT